MHRTFALIATGLVLGVCTATWADEKDQNADSKEQKTLRIGDQAPSFDIEHWIKLAPWLTDDDREAGEPPLTAFRSDNVYVLEFWATWCGPCIAGMPHLSELQEQYDDGEVTIIGVSDEPLHVVVPFLFKTYGDEKIMHNERMRYTVATDPDESVWNDYFRAAGQTGIPCAFIIGKTGKVEWIGHPMRMDEPLAQVVADEWDHEAFAAQFRKQQEQRQIQRKYFAARRAGNIESAASLLDQMLDADPDDANLRMQKFELMLTAMDKPEEAYAIGRSLLEDNWDEPQALNAMAWMVVDNPAVKKRNLEFAMRAASRASELTQGEDAAILDTLARVHYEMAMRQLQKALQTQRKAAEHAGEGPMAEDIKRTLEKYKQFAEMTQEQTS
jgi:thioredoxin-like negative regulator of GroEL